MRKVTFLYLILLNITVLANGKYGITELISGLPKEAENQTKYYKEPFYASLPTNNAFQKVFLLWDKTNQRNYALMVIFNNSFKCLISTYFKKSEGYIFSDSSSFQNEDQFNSIVPYEIHLNSKRLELEYYWCKSKENGFNQQGGIPQFVKPRLCKGKMMPEFSFKTLEGEQISSEKLKGKFIFIDFWGTWCGGCIYEIPKIITMREKISTDKLFVVGFVNDNADSVKKYILKNPFNYPNVIVDEAYLNRCEVKLYPTKVLIDPHGEILTTKFRGENIWENVLKAINDYENE